MRLVLATVFAVLVAAGTAQAERKMFIISSNASGYGVDRCLSNGEKCGAPLANAYCKSQQFKQAASYQKVDPAEITGAIPTGASGGCTGTACDVVAIVCTR
ncbi:MAG: hypothetical protein AB7O50_06345 [Pseudolabrys sp.]